MVTLIIYLLGGIIGMITHFVFDTDSVLKSFAQFSILISFIYTFIGRFVPNVRSSLIKMVPSIIPFPKFIVYLTGILEVIIAVGVLIYPIQSLMSMIGIILCIILFPANVKAFKEKIDLNGKPPTNIWLRLVVQLLFIFSFYLILII